VSIIFGGMAITVIAGVFYNNINAVASIVNFGSLFTFLFVHLSVIKMRRDHPATRRPFQVPLYPVVPVLGIGSCVLLMIYLSNTAKLAAGGWAVIAIIVYYLYSRKQ
jgi:APA family basic amino acid/polyamine antiporter